MRQATSQDIPLGTWRTHASYTEIQLLAELERGVFAASRNGLFFFNNTDRSITRLSKLDGLSGGQYTSLAYDKPRNTLVVGYENGLIDLVSANGEVTTITELADARLTGSSAINHIEVHNSTYFLSVSIGVLAVDADSRIIRATYRNLGAQGQELPISSTAVFNDSLFLAAGTDLLTVPLNSSVNPQDFNSYTRYPWSNGSLLYLESANGYLVAASPSYLAEYQGNGFLAEIPESPSEIRNLSASAEGILVAGDRSVFLFGPTLDPINSGGAVDLLAVAGSVNGALYISDRAEGLIIQDAGNTEAFRPNGILHPEPGRLYSRSQKTFALYRDPGTIGDGKVGFSVFENGTWQNYAIAIPSANDIPAGGVFSAVAYRPADNSYYLGTYGNGLLRWNDQHEFSVIDENTAGAPFSTGATQITALHTTAEGDLLMTSYNEGQPLYKLTSEGEWSQIFLSGSLRTSIADVTSTFTGDYFLLSRPQSSSGGIIAVRDQPDAAQATLTQNTNDLPGRILYDLTEDLDGRLYIGGLAGVAFLPFPSIVFEETASVQRPVFDQRFLLENETITAITIDGGDRKWLGTYNGAWLFDDSGENIEQVYHFTTDNSPLPSDTLYDISINSITGEVFFATSGGLVSYREGATSGSRFYDQVNVFPNPVPSDFSGQVGISGLATGVSVKITNAKGKLLRELESEGGTATWDLRNDQGRRMGPGVYIIFSANRDGTESYAGKLAILP